MSYNDRPIHEGFKKELCILHDSHVEKIPDRWFIVKPCVCLHCYGRGFHETPDIQRGLFDEYITLCLFSSKNTPPTIYDMPRGVAADLIKILLKRMFDHFPINYCNDFVKHTLGDCIETLNRREAEQITKAAEEIAEEEEAAEKAEGAAETKEVPRK